MKGNDALASLPPAAQPEGARPVDVADPLNDPTIILQGSQMLLGKAAWSAGRMTVDAEPIAAYMKAQAEKERREAEEAGQLERLAAWGRETTNVGGVAMTNVEAQEARQRVIDNDEAYANWAVKTGRIREDDKDDFKAAIRRKKELEDKRGRGTLTDAEAAEEERLNRSRAGQAADAATAQNHQTYTQGHELTTQQNDSNALLRQPRSTLLVDQSVFQDFKEATPVRTADRPPVADRVKATGLDL